MFPSDSFSSNATLLLLSSSSSPLPIVVGRPFCPGHSHRLGNFSASETIIGAIIIIYYIGSIYTYVLVIIYVNNNNNNRRRRTVSFS